MGNVRLIPVKKGKKMVALTDLWLPILLSGAAVWIASALAWMVLPHHKGDYRQLPNEDALMASVRQLNIAPGLYFFPHMKECNKSKMDPIAKEKFERGPHGLIQIWPPEAFGNMGRNMLLSFIFYLIVGVFVAYLATLGVQPGSEFMHVFRFAGAAGIMAYTLAQIPHQIWFGTPLRNVIACLADGIAYGLITGAIFAWLWPAA
jgi:hypothetical protein